MNSFKALFESALNKGTVGQVITELFTANYNAYPESYCGADAEQNAEQVAKDYFANRSESEVERDNKADVSEGDYVQWCLSALEYFKNKEESWANRDNWK